jgi:hypothetical protein
MNSFTFLDVTLAQAVCLTPGLCRQYVPHEMSCRVMLVLASIIILVSNSRETRDHVLASQGYGNRKLSPMSISVNSATTFHRSLLYTPVLW